MTAKKTAPKPKRAASKKSKAKADPLRKMGRPTKRTKEVEESIFRALRSGVAMRSACYIARVDPDTVARWAKQDGTFAASIEKAKGSARARVAAAVFERAINGEVVAAIWWQKCQDPEFREPRDRNIVIPMAKAVRDQSGIAEAVFAVINESLSGRVSPHAIRDVVASLSSAAELLSKTEIESRLLKLEQEIHE